MKTYKSSEKVRTQALAYYYANREKCLLYQEAQRRARGVPVRKPAMTAEERLAATMICKTCGGEVTAPTMKLKRSHKCTKCIRRGLREKERAKGTSGAEQRRYRTSITGAVAKFKAWKAEQSCSKCGYTGDPELLHFHHKDPTQKVAKIARMLYRYGAKRLWEEVAKCDIVCKTCHEGIHGVPLPRS